MRRRRTGLLYALVALLALALLQSALVAQVRAQEYLRIHGYVFDEGGSPLSGATVLAFNYHGVRVENVVTTDESGHYEMTVKGGVGYIIYAIHYDAERGMMDYVPAKLDIKDVDDALEVRANFTLYRAAYVLLDGDIYYVGGATTRDLRLFVLTPEGRPVSDVLPAGRAEVTTLIEKVERRVELLSRYGTFLDVTLAFYIAERQGVIPKGLLHKRIGLVPAGREVVLRVVSTVLDKRVSVEGTAKEFVFDVFSPDNPKVFRPFETLRIDLTWESLRRSVSLVMEDVRYTENLMGRYEAMGFYLAAEREELAKATTLVEEAKAIFGRESPDAVMDRLERAFVIARRIIIARLHFMSLVAKEGALILPMFISAFAVTLAFYFFEESRKKLYFFVIFYAVLMTVFALSYPGFPLMTSEPALLFASIGAAFALVLILIFVVPRYVREPEVPGKLSRGALVAVTFSMAKRYSRLRKSRTIITVFSLAALIWAFTVLASIATVYGYVESTEPYKPPVEGMLAMRVINQTKLMPLGYYDYLWFLNRSGVALVSPRVFASPIANLTLIVKSPAGRVVTLKGALGLSPVEDEVTGVSRIIKRGSFASISELNAIMLPEGVAAKLGVKVGDEVTVYFRIPGQASRAFKLRVAAIFYPERLDMIRDVNNEPIKPVLFVRGKYAYANSTETAIMNWEFMLRNIFPDPKTGLSSVAGIYRIYVRCHNATTMRKLARTFIERKGPDYMVWFAYGGTCWKAMFGMKSESIFERRENVAFLIPIAIVAFNVIVSMYSIVHERRREIYIFNAIGFNPLQVAMIFLAESIVYGLLGGGIGYISGIVTFRAMSAHAAEIGLMVREKLEWYWSVITVVMAVLVSMISSFKPALDAAFKYSPAIVRKHKIEAEERERREEVFLRTTTGKSVGIPVKVEEGEAPIFFSYLYTRLKDLAVGYTERTEEIKEEPEEEYPDGRRVKRFKFKYIFTVDDKRYIIDNEIVMTKLPKADYYTIELTSTPTHGMQVPMKYIDRVAMVVRDIAKGWLSERKRLLGV